MPPACPSTPPLLLPCKRAVRRAAPAGPHHLRAELCVCCVACACTALSCVYRVRPADVLLVLPQRKAPSEALQRAAAEAAGVDLPDEDDEPLRFSMRPDAWGWEKALGRFLQVGRLVARVLRGTVGRCVAMHVTLQVGW